MFSNFIGIRFTVDITAYHRGFHADLNETLFVGNVDDESKKLVRVAHECLYKSIDMGKITSLYMLLLWCCRFRYSNSYFL